MEVPYYFLVLSIMLSSFAETCCGTTFSSIVSTLNVTASPAQNQVLKAGVDNITITWAYNLTIGTDSDYTTVEAKLCYAPVSQTGRDDRKTFDHLDHDKTCPFDITNAPYKPSNNSFIWTIPKDIPTATYFVRVYAMNAANQEVAYGQTTDQFKTTNLFQIENSAAWSLFRNSFGYHYAWLLILFLV